MHINYIYGIWQYQVLDITKRSQVLIHRYDIKINMDYETTWYRQLTLWYHKHKLKMQNWKKI